MWFKVLSMADPVNVNYSVVETMFSQKQISAEKSTVHKKQPTTVRPPNNSVENCRVEVCQSKSLKGNNKT